MSRTLSRFIAAAVAVSLVAAACGEDTSEETVPTTTRATTQVTTAPTQAAPTEEAAETPSTIVEVALEAGTFPTLVAAVQAAGLVDTLNSDGPFTVFAPTEEAFATALNTLGVTADELLANTELLAAVLRPPPRRGGGHPRRHYLSGQFGVGSESGLQGLGGRVPHDMFGEGPRP